MFKMFKGKRLLSLFLALIMIFTLVPFSVLGEGNDGDHQDQGMGDGTKYTVQPTTSFFGLRFSLYFAEGLSDESEIDSSTNFTNLGQIEANILVDSYPTYWSGLNVYDRMHDESRMSQTLLQKVDYKSVITTSSQLPILSKIPKIYKSNATKSGDLDIFFMGVKDYDYDNQTDDQYAKLDFKNTIEIANYILKKSNLGYIPYDKSMNSDGTQKNIDGFRDGYYIDGYGVKHSGIFKLHYEPVYSYNLKGGVRYAMTLRDLIAYTNVNPEMKLVEQYLTSAYRDQAKMVFLERNQPHINMGDGTPDFDSEKVKVGITPSGNIYKNGGVGAVTGGIYAPGPEVYKTYVFIDTVDADGNITYKKADPSVQERAEFIIDDSGNLTQTPNFNLIEGTASGLAVLNDIFSVPMDLDVSDSTEWVNTPLITNAGEEVRPIVTDVPGYNLSLITGSDVFIDSLVQISGGMSANAAQISRAIETSAQGLMQQAATASNLAAAEVSSETFVGYLPMRSVYAPNGLYSYVTLDITSAVFYEKFEDIRLGMFDSESKNKIIKSEINENHTSTIDNKSIPANNLVLRYVVVPKPGQFDVIERRNRTTGEVLGYIYAGRQNLEISEDNTVTIQKPVVENLELLGDPEIVEWVTNSEYPVKDISTGTLPNVSPNGLTGTTESPIPNYPEDPLTHNLYVKWVIYEDDESQPTSAQYRVPEWRLSKYWGAYGEVPTSVATMSLPVSYGCCWETLSPSGPWNYTTRNPNGLLTIPGHDPANLKLYSWIHSETVHSGVMPNITIGSPSAIVPISTTVIGIKSTDTSNLMASNWLNKESLTGLLKYDILNSSVGKPFNVSEYTKSTTLLPNTYNLDTYTNKYTVKTGSKPHRHRTVTKTISPGGAAYTSGLIDITITFDRYLQQNTDNKKLIVSPEINVENGLTTLKYQLKDTLTVYPEIGMLFDNDSNQESIKWVVGDQARKINPVVWQTLEHKVYVVPTSSGTSVATDSRAITKAQSLGESGKQVIHKGAGVNTTFQLFRDEDKDTKSILTVKTFALDFASSSSKNASTLLNGVDVKSAWGNSAYNSQAQHDKLIAELKKTGKADATEKLLVDINLGGNAEYTGAEKNQKTADYKVMTYSGKEVTTFEHQLIVRGGSLIAVGYNDRSNPSGFIFLPFFQKSQKWIDMA